MNKRFEISLKELEKSYYLSSYAESKRIKRFKNLMHLVVNNLMLIFFVFLSLVLLIVGLFF